MFRTTAHSSVAIHMRHDIARPSDLCRRPDRLSDGARPRAAGRLPGSDRASGRRAQPPPEQSRHHLDENASRRARATARASDMRSEVRSSRARCRSPAEPRSAPARGTLGGSRRWSSRRRRRDEDGGYRAATDGTIGSPRWNDSIACASDRARNPAIPDTGREVHGLLRQVAAGVLRTLPWRREAHSFAIEGGIHGRYEARTSIETRLANRRLDSEHRHDRLHRRFGAGRRRIDLAAGEGR